LRAAQCVNLDKLEELPRLLLPLLRKLAEEQLDEDIEELERGRASGKLVEGSNRQIKRAKRRQQDSAQTDNASSAASAEGDAKKTKKPEQPAVSGQ